MMSFYTILLIAIALGTDAFSLAVCMGLNRINKIELYVFPFVVALFHIIMPLTGLWLGDILGKTLGKMAGFIGALVLVLIGLHMFREAWLTRKESPSCENTTSLIGARVLTGFWAIILASASVSLDALTVGLGLGVMDVNLSLTVLTIGLAAGLMTLIGLFFGKKLGSWLGEKAQLFGGVMLMLIGFTMFF